MAPLFGASAIERTPHFPLSPEPVAFMRDDSTALRALATKCRRLARGVSMTDVAVTLGQMAADYDQ